MRLGFPGGSDSSISLPLQETQVRSLSCEDPRSRKWQPTSVFLPGKSHRQRSLVGYSPWGFRDRHDWATNTHKGEISMPVRKSVLSKDPAVFSNPFPTSSPNKVVAVVQLWPHGLKHTRTPCSLLLELAQTLIHWVGDALQPSYPLSSPSPPAFNPSQHQGLFQWVGSSFQIRWPKYWSFSFSISPSGEYSGLISFRTDWFDFLEVQGTLKSLQHSLKAPVLQGSAFFMV